MYTQNHFPLHSRNGRKGKGKIFHRLQCQPITLQVTSALLQSKPIRGDDELTLLSCLGPDLLLLYDTAREAACALHIGACVMHTHRSSQAASPFWKLLTETFFAVLVLWHLPSIRSIINYSQPQQCVPVSECMFVCERVHMSVCITVCIWSRYALIESLGSPAPLSESAFSSLPPGTWACFCGHSQDRSMMLHLWTLFARCLVLSSSELWA